MQQEEVQLRRSTGDRRSEIPDDYIFFLQEHVTNMEKVEDILAFLQEHEESTGLVEDDPISFRQAMKTSNSKQWIIAMNEEYKSMQDNKVRELVPLPEGVKPIGCKWIFRTKRDSKGNVV